MNNKGEGQCPGRHIRTHNPARRKSGKANLKLAAPTISNQVFIYDNFFTVLYLVVILESLSCV